MKHIELIGNRAAILEAELVGLYHKELPLDKCRHVTCGFIRPKKCYYQERAVPTDNVPWYTEQHKNHDPLWCSSHAPKPKKLNIPVSCKKTTYKLLSEKDLIKPDVKPDVIAMGMTIASGSAISYSMVALYDLQTDKFITNPMWYQITPSGNLTTKTQFPWDLVPNVNEIHDIHDLISVMKAKL